MKKVLVFLVIALVSCSAKQNLIQRYSQTYIPPNGYNIGNGIFVDRTEIANIDWREYQQWIVRVYGKESREHMEALPDTLVWIGQIDIDTLLSEKYYRSKEFNDFPVVGVTQKQAHNYSKWRSDVVFESMLINLGILEPLVEKTRDNHFTIEKYLSGKYLDYKPDTSITFIPIFTLPTSQDVELIDSLVNENINYYFENCTEIYCDECNSIESLASSKGNFNENIILYDSPIRPNFVDCLIYSFLDIHNFLGNVSEWSSNESEVYGGSWNDVLSNNTIKLNKIDSTKSAFVGFRNVCRLEPVNFSFYSNL